MMMFPMTKNYIFTMKNYPDEKMTSYVRKKVIFYGELAWKK